jgi:hypothetical protein
MSCINHLEEEVQEMKADFEKGLIRDEEIADCFLLLVGVANKAGLSYTDLMFAIENKMQVNYARKWGEVNEKGYVKHVEPTKALINEQN